MDNNAYVPVLVRGTAMFALNGKCILVCSVLHVPDLAVPLYSLRTHLTQRGCGFIGTHKSRFLVYFPTFVLSVNTVIDCHLSFNPLGSWLVCSVGYLPLRPTTLLSGCISLRGFSIYIYCGSFSSFSSDD